MNIKKFSKSSDEIKVGAWVAVIYDSWYSGLVEKVNDNDKLEINFMNRSGKIFYWSPKPDKQEIPKNEILCKIVNPPFPISARHFKIDNFKTIDDICKNVLKFLCVKRFFFNKLF